MPRTIEQKREYNKNWQRNFREKNPEYGKMVYLKRQRQNIKSSQDWYRENLVGTFDKKMRGLLYKAKQRATEKGIEFLITMSDLAPVTHCPLLGIELSFSNSRGQKTNSPSIDRIDPSCGYVAGNVWVISARANQIKNDATLGEVEMIALNLRKKINGD